MIPAWFIQEVTATHNGKPVLTAQWGPSISKNPFLQFVVKGAKAGDKISLGFVVETERQVEQHLAGHLERLPDADKASRAIVARMKDEESAHGRAAGDAGAARMPAPVRWLMRGAAKVMTTTAHRI